MQLLPSCHETEFDKCLEQMYYVKAIMLLVDISCVNCQGGLPPKPEGQQDIDDLNNQIRQLEKQRRRLLANREL